MCLFKLGSVENLDVHMLQMFSRLFSLQYLFMTFVMVEFSYLLVLDGTSFMVPVILLVCVCVTTEHTLVLH